jgi:N-acetylglutamate synthase-like GNAT family acetyltransferase
VTMATHPNYQRKGIGRLLVQWGVDVAEQLGLPIYLEATSKGCGLFESAGFERLTHEKLVHKASVIGQKEDEEVPLMVKMPSKAHGQTFQDWAAKGYPDSY